MSEEITNDTTQEPTTEAETQTISAEEKASNLETALRKEREEKRQLKEQLANMSKTSEPAVTEAPAPEAPASEPTVDVAKEVERVITQRDFERELAEEVEDEGARAELRKVFSSTFNGIPSDSGKRKKLIGLAKQLVTENVSKATDTTSAMSGGSSRSNKGAEAQEQRQFATKKEENWSNHFKRKAEQLKR